MKFGKIALIIIGIGLLIFAGRSLLKGQPVVCDYTGERVLYSITPAGKSEYKDFGIVDLNGTKANLAVFKTKVLLFEDTEKIYSDPRTLLPYRVEREIYNMGVKEFIIEEYDQANFTVTMKKYRGGTLMREWKTKTSGPIHNAIMLPFYLRQCPDLCVGWQFTARFPDEFKLELASIDNITVPAGEFQAYHFKSSPERFEIWISKDDAAVPLKIKGTGIFPYALLMEERNFQKS
ncbi:MAG: hypothetical protein NTV07_05490 [Candidatus Omnitrophica bacterium]|nr:hypothetical protein [Candidatus Omnitrophota bacterium]